MKSQQLILPLLPLLSQAAPSTLQPRQENDPAIILINLGPGDSATTLEVPLQTTVVTNFFNRNSARSEVSIPSGVFCGGFEDTGATVLIGNVFDSTNPAEYGSPDDNEDTSAIGSYWCSRNKAAVERRAVRVIQPVANERENNGGGNNNNNNNNNGGNNKNNNNGGNNNGGGATVNLQIERAANAFTGIDVPINQLITSRENAQLGDSIIVLDVVSGTGIADDFLIHCQAFSDQAGNNPIGPPATLDKAAVIGEGRRVAVPLGAIRCSDKPVFGGSGGNDNKDNNKDNKDKNNGGGGGNNNNVQGNVELQIERRSDEFRGTSVPVNRLVTVNENRQLIGKAIRIDVVGGDGNIQQGNIRCQAWADEAGTQRIGEPATVGMASELTGDRRRPARFKAITCRA